MAEVRKPMAPEPAQSIFILGLDSITPSLENPAWLVFVLDWLVG